MRTSERGINLIRHFEALRLEAYLCPAGRLTIGYGHTKDVHPDDRISADKAEQLLCEDLRTPEMSINRESTEVNQNQFDALVSFAFNVGTTQFLRSTLLKKVKANACDPAIRKEFMRWTKADGIVLAGLVRRRKAESDLYFS